MSDRAKKWLWPGVRFAISAGALTYVITRTSFPDLVKNVRGLRLGPLALATWLIGGLVNLLSSVEDIVDEGEEDSGAAANQGVEIAQTDTYQPDIYAF